MKLGTTYRNRTAGLQAQVSYWDMVLEASVTKAAVHMGEGDGDVNRAQGCIKLASESGLRTGMCADTVE